MEKRVSHLSEQILEEASAWFLAFNENQVDQRGRENFNAWLRRSPECVRAFLQVSAFWEDAGIVEGWSKVDVDTLIAESMGDKNVVSLEVAGSDQGGSPISQSWLENPRTNVFDDTEAAATDVPQARRQVWRAAAAVLLCVGLGVAAWYTSYFSPTYVTGIGEQRSITLQDGSLVELNARSRLRVRFTEKLRSVELLEGQALFTVAKNPARPFVVSTSESSVRAVGTQFDVYRKRAGTVVTVMEGRVAVQPVQKTARANVSRQMPRPLESARTRREVLLVAGEQATVSLTSVSPPERVDTAAATAWTEKKLVFESTPLGDVVDEFNRYNRRQLVIRDPQLLDFHVSGVFPSTDSERMIELLRQRFGIVTETTEHSIEISMQQKAIR
jgi:transmembrane sensor